MNDETIETVRIDNLLIYKADYRITCRIMLITIGRGYRKRRQLKTVGTRGFIFLYHHIIYFRFLTFPANFHRPQQSGRCKAVDREQLTLSSETWDLFRQLLQIDAFVDNVSTV